MGPMNEHEGDQPEQQDANEKPQAPNGTEQLLKSLEKTEHALFVLIQSNGKMAAKLANALRRIEALEQDQQYVHLLLSNLHHHTELEVQQRPVQIDSIIGNLVHPGDEGYDEIQNGTLRIKNHEPAHPVYGAYEVLVTDVEHGGSPHVQTLESLHPKAQELIVSEFERLRREEKLDQNVFYGTNFQALTRGRFTENSVPTDQDKIQQAIDTILPMAETMADLKNSVPAESKAPPKSLIELGMESDVTAEVDHAVDPT